MKSLIQDHSRGCRVLVVLLAVLLSGCQAMTRERPHQDDPRFAPVTPADHSQNTRENGAIYQVTRNHNLWGDTKALNVGDIVTIDLQEETQASKRQNSQIQKDSEIEATLANILGQDLADCGPDIDFERDFQARTNADQGNSLAGNITVTVIEVLGNGALRVRGEKWLSLTNGEEYIRLTGIVRQEDITSDNRVPSSRIADARISYGATGDFDQANRQGWLARFFNSEWWPF